jgi:CDGSH-type Zn-finger protein
MTDEEAVIAQKSPYPVAVEAGKSYWYCTCGRTKTQPFCDGTHKASSFAPVAYKAEQDEIVYFCGCRQSANGVTCDGTHESL